MLDKTLQKVNNFDKKKRPHFLTSTPEPLLFTSGCNGNKWSLDRKELCKTVITFMPHINFTLQIANLKGFDRDKVVYYKVPVAPKV